jgi:hypothetical protein
MNILSKFRRHGSFIIYNPVVMFQNHYCNYFLLLYVIKALIFHLAQKVTLTKTRDKIIARLLGETWVLATILPQHTWLKRYYHNCQAWLSQRQNQPPHPGLVGGCSGCHPLECTGQPWRGLQRWR